MKKLVLLTMIVLLLAACVKEVPPPTVTEPAEVTNRSLQNGKPFRMVVPNNQHPIVRIMMLGFFEACEHYEVDCVMAGIDFVDISALIARSEETISLGSSGVLYYPDTVLYPAMQNIMAARIPVVSFHVPQPPEARVYQLAWVAANGIDYAERSAIAMCEKLGDATGSVALTVGSFNDVETPVAEAFTAKMAEVCPALKVLVPQEEGFEPSASAAKASAILTANPDLVAAYSTTGAGATTWMTAARDAGKQPGDIIIISMDYSEQNLDLVRDGWVYALVGQPLYEQSWRGVELLIDILHGRAVEYINWYPAPLIFAADVDIYYDYGKRVNLRWK